MNKEEVNLVAQVLIAKYADAADSFIFDDCDEILTMDEQQKILDRISYICNKTINRLNKSYGLNLGSVNDTKSIIEHIFYE